MAPSEIPPYTLVQTSDENLPIGIDLFKKHIRVELIEEYEDDVLALYLDQAHRYVREQADVSLIQTDYRLTLPCFPSGARTPIPLLRPPLVTVSEIRYIDPDGVENNFTDYRVMMDNDAVQPDFDFSWPATRSNTLDAVKIEYTAGGNDPSASNTRASRGNQAIILLAAHWFKNREETTDKQLSSIPHGVQSLIEHMRPGNEFERVLEEIYPGNLGSYYG